SRGLYKDLLTLLRPGADSTQRRGSLIWDQDLRNKLEPSFGGDRMTAVNTNGDATDFTEVREFRTPEHLVHFYFTTRVFKEKLESFIIELRRNPPDVLFMQSCIWDQSRYDMNAEGHMEEYAKRLGRLCRLLSSVLPPTTTFVFLLLPPAEEGIANKGFLGDPRVRRYHKERLNWHMRLANFVAAQVITSFGFDVCDLLPHFDRAKLNIFREYA
ncbi:PC-Esterase, partial [Aphelenchoides avenae]